MSWEDGKKFVRCKPDGNTRFTMMGWVAGIDQDKLIARIAEQRRREAELAKLAKREKKAKKAKQAEQALAPRVKPSSPVPAPALVAHSSPEDPGPSPTSIPPPGPPAPVTSTDAHFATFVSVSDFVETPAGVFNSGANSEQYPVPYPIPFATPVFAPPPPGPPAGSFSPSQPKTSLKAEPVSVPRTNVVYREGAGQLPSQITFVAAHHCSECGHLRSREYHRLHPLTPGTIAHSGPCRRCRHRDNHRFVEIDQPVAYVVEQERHSRRHKRRYSERRQAHTEATVPHSRSISPRPCRESSPRGRQSGRPERQEGEIHYRHVSVRRSSNPHPRNFSQQEDSRLAERREQSREYRHKRIIRASPPSDDSADERQINGSELIVRRRRKVFREASPKEEVSSHRRTRIRKVYRDSLVLPNCLRGTSESKQPLLVDRLANTLFEGSSAARASRRNWSRSIGHFALQSVRN